MDSMGIGWNDHSDNHDYFSCVSSSTTVAKFRSSEKCAELTRDASDQHEMRQTNMRYVEPAQDVLNQREMCQINAICIKSDRDASNQREIRQINLKYAKSTRFASNQPGMYQINSKCLANIITGRSKALHFQ